MKENKWSTHAKSVFIIGIREDSLFKFVGDSTAAIKTSFAVSSWEILTVSYQVVFSLYRLGPGSVLCERPDAEPTESYTPTAEATEENVEHQQYEDDEEYSPKSNKGEIPKRKQRRYRWK